jgi:surfactin synthase thioesterase subunit
MISNSNHQPDFCTKAVLAEPELMQIFLPILRADFRLMETYRYVEGEPLHLPITVCGGLDDRLVSRADLNAWQELTCGPCSVHLLQGSHFYLRRNQTQLLRLVQQQLSE